MAPIRWFSRLAPWLSGALLGGCFALVATAAPASAEISSVDAYGGQAQVLGKPVHHHRPVGGSPAAQGSGREGGQSTGATGAQTSGGSSESSSGSSSHSTSGSSPGASTTPSGGSPSANHTSSGNTAGSASAGGTGSHGTATAGVVSGRSGTGQSPPVAVTNVAAVSDGSLSLSALDVLLLVAVVLGLAGVGVLIRRWSRQEPLSK